MWKDLQSVYDWVIINFLSSGNNNCNFTKAAMAAFRDQGRLGVEEDVFDETKEDEVFGGGKGLLLLYKLHFIIYLN
jgi:hypothetical protein